MVAETFANQPPSNARIEHPWELNMEGETHSKPGIWENPGMGKTPHIFLNAGSYYQYREK
jgi:hypothetical protein